MMVASGCLPVYVGSDLRRMPASPHVGRNGRAGHHMDRMSLAVFTL